MLCAAGYQESASHTHSADCGTTKCDDSQQGEVETLEPPFTARDVDLFSRCGKQYGSSSKN